MTPVKLYKQRLKGALRARAEGKEALEDAYFEELDIICTWLTAEEYEEVNSLTLEELEKEEE